MWSHDQKNMWLGKWNPLNLSHHCFKFYAYRFYGKGDITFVFCPMTSRDHMIKTTYGFVGVPQPKLPRQVSCLYVLWKWI